MIRRIPYALFLKDWSFENGSKENLIEQAQKITSDEFDVNEMKNFVFCPKCYTKLTRSPLEVNYTKEGVSAFFKHIPSYSHIKCEYRANKGEAFNYANEAEAREAIENENLVIVHSFKTEEPSLNDENIDNSEEDYEDDVDATSDVTVNRHRTQSLSLPSKITTVRGGVCRNFDTNLLKGYYLPHSNQVLPLSDLLNNVKDIEEPNTEKRLFIGKIIGTEHKGSKLDNNIRMTYLEFNSKNGYKDFCIKTEHWLQSKHGIGDDSIDRFVIFYGAITENGIGLCVENLRYGEFGLLSEKYNKIASSLLSE